MILSPEKDGQTWKDEVLIDAGASPTPKRTSRLLEPPLDPGTQAPGEVTLNGGADTPPLPPLQRAWGPGSREGAFELQGEVAPWYLVARAHLRHAAPPCSMGPRCLGHKDAPQAPTCEGSRFPEPHGWLPGGGGSQNRHWKNKTFYIFLVCAGGPFIGGPLTRCWLPICWGAACLVSPPCARPEHPLLSPRTCSQHSVPFRQAGAEIFQAHLLILLGRGPPAGGGGCPLSWPQERGGQGLRGHGGPGPRAPSQARGNCRPSHPLEQKWPLGLRTGQPGTSQLQAAKPAAVGQAEPASPWHRRACHVGRQGHLKATCVGHRQPLAQQRGPQGQRPAAGLPAPRQARAPLRPPNPSCCP